MNRLVSISLAALISAFATTGCATGAPQVQTVYRDPVCVSGSPVNSTAAYAVDVWSPERTPFRVGEALALNMRSAAPAYLSLFHVSSSCKASQLIANKKVEAGETASFPSDGLRATIKPPGGQEFYILVATTSPLDWRTGSDMLPGGAVVTLDMTPQEMVSRLNQTLARLAPRAWNAKTMVATIIEN